MSGPCAGSGRACRATAAPCTDYTLAPTNYAVRRILCYEKNRCGYRSILRYGPGLCAGRGSGIQSPGDLGHRPAGGQASGPAGAGARSHCPLCHGPVPGRSLPPLSGGPGAGAAGDRGPGKRRRVRQVHSLCGDGHGLSAGHCGAERPGPHRHVPHEPALHASGQQDHQPGLQLRLAAGALYERVRRQQGLCAQLLPGPGPGAEGAGYPGAVRMPRVGENGVHGPGRS